MTADKKKAAYKAAAKYSTDPYFAIMEFAKLTERSDIVYTEIVNLSAELFSLLPPYRCPVHDEVLEQMIFFNPDGVKFNFTISQTPEFVMDLKRAGVADNILSTVKKYVRGAELCKIELAQCKDELVALKAKLSKARRVYDEHQDERPSSRNTKVVQSIGLSTGKNPKHINSKNAYIDYVKLVRKKGRSRREAAEIIKNKYGYHSYNATLKDLYQYRSIVYKKWDQIYPSSLSIIKKHMKGLIPSRKY